MGTDRYDIDRPCPCGAGTINVEQESPDHPWARASQTHYSARLDCRACAATYVVVHSVGGSRPYLTLKTEMDAKGDARAEHRILEEKFRQHDLARSLEPALIAEIDQALAKSMAAAHRVLVSYGLTYESLPSYRKRPVDGAAAVKSASGARMARIGETLGATEAERAAFTKVRRKLDELFSASQKSTSVVKTGHPWLKA